MTSNRDKTGTKVPGSVSTNSLSESESAVAFKAKYVPPFRELERGLADPAVPQQSFGLISFIPSKGATPDKDGFFGFAKLRGNYSTVQEASDRAEFIIKNHDSYHKIYTTYVGKPFPITQVDLKDDNRQEINIKNKAKQTMSDDVKERRVRDAKEIKEIKDREQELLDDVNEDVKKDPIEAYTVLRVKKAQLVWTYLETEKKMLDMKNSIIKVRKEITDMEATNPTHREGYMKKYVDAREKAGIPTEQAANDTSFMRFMVEDGKLPF
ncbi:hypothetical protein OAF54_03125 [bacterium]|nr:hypothetical protein [bacterium]